MVTLLLQDTYSRAVLGWMTAPDPCALAQSLPMFSPDAPWLQAQLFAFQGRAPGEHLLGVGVQGAYTLLVGTHGGQLAP